MADAIIGGLVLSTAPSLFVVPAFYLLADRAKQRSQEGEAGACGSGGMTATWTDCCLS